MDVVELPANVYSSLRKEIDLLRDQSLLIMLNEIIEIMYQNKYGLYLGNYTEDLSAASIDNINEWKIAGHVWDGI